MFQSTKLTLKKQEMKKSTAHQKETKIEKRLVI